MCTRGREHEEKYAQGEVYIRSNVHKGKCAQEANEGDMNKREVCPGAVSTGSSMNKGKCAQGVVCTRDSVNKEEACTRGSVHKEQYA